LAIEVPESYATEAQQDQGTSVQISLQEVKLFITPIRKAYTLDEPLSGVTDEIFIPNKTLGKPSIKKYGRDKHPVFRIEGMLSG
jgi:antitoxin component of MazEF toxin-antitoxin module